MRRHLQLEILLIPFVFTVIASFLVPKSIGFSGGLVLAVLEMIAVSFPLFVRGQMPARREHAQGYFFTNLLATGAICLIVWSIRTALIPFFR